MQKQDQPVAFFDSGLGGISVLRETVRLLPQENSSSAIRRTLSGESPLMPSL